MPPTTPQAPSPSTRLTAGPLDTESALLDDLARRRATPDGWSTPLVLATPSRALQDHLRAALVERFGAALGVRVTTLFGLALEVTEDVAGHQLAGTDLFPLFARRLAREQPALRRALESLNDGYAALLAPVRDLLDAGFDAALADGMIEALDAEGRAVASRQEVERAKALVSVTAGTAESLAQVGAGRRSTLLTAAAERVRQDGRAALSADSVWFYGFADASGVARDLIEALLERFAGRLYLDQPFDPAAPGELDAGVVFTRRFRERIESRAPVATPSPDRGEAPAIEMFRALGSDGEVREVARRIRELLDGGVRPERITVVARQLQPYTRPLRQHFGALGLPYSAQGAQAAKDRLGRRADALADLLERGPELSVERWLELVDRRFDGASHADLRTGFATLGCGRLREVAALAADAYLREHKLKLPVRHGFAEVENTADAGRAASRGVRLRYRYVAAEALAAATDAAAALVAHHEACRGIDRLADHLEATRRLLVDQLGWRDDRQESALVERIESIWAGLPVDFELDHDEFRRALVGPLREFGRRPLGGIGGGVQILDVIGARGLTSEHLFLLGLNRGVFPRVVTEDPLLPDGLRGVLSRQGAGVLPDLPDKLEGFDEERFLFAQLLASSPRVTLSWQDTDDDQTPLAPSPLVDRLRWAGGDETWRHPELAVSVLAQPAAVPRSALENAIVVALRASRSRLGEVLARLRPEAGEDDAASAAAIAARLRALAELDPDRRTDAGRDAARRLGPYFGFLGSAAAGDPRADQRLFVTTLERLSGCPWQVVLRRLLGLEPVPDPLAALPGITPLLIGALVHDVLEQIVRRGLVDDPENLAQARQRLPQAVAWPDAKELDDILYRAALALCRREGIAVEGFARVLTLAVAPHLEIARQLDWSDGGLHVLGVELFGDLEVEDLRGTTRRIHFRADRLDLGETGLTLTDYKTGRRPVSTAKLETSRRKHLLESVWSGERLQAVAYAQAAGHTGDFGRYLFIGPDVSDDRSVRDVRIAADDRELDDAFRQAAGTALATWDLGTFFPRLVNPDRDEEPTRCQYCEVRDACLRGDSGARRRLREWAEREHRRFADGAALESDELALLSLWRLPASAKGKGGGRR